MALTDTQKSEARRYLGAPDVYRQYDLRLEAAMDALSTTGEAQVVAILTELAAIQTQLADARACRIKVKEVVGDVVLAGDDEIRTLWREGNRLCQDLGVALYFTPRRRAFGSRAASWSMEAGNVARRG